MMIDYNVSDHWSADVPDWLRSLVSSLDRRHGCSTVLALTIVVEEILEWVELASGADAWRKGANRDALQFDLEQALAALGTETTSVIAESVDAFRAAFGQLCGSPRAVLQQPPGTRTDAVWLGVLTVWA